MRCTQGVVCLTLRNQRRRSASLSVRLFEQLGGQRHVSFEKRADAPRHQEHPPVSHIVIQLELARQLRVADEIVFAAPVNAQLSLITRRTFEMQPLGQTQPQVRACVDLLAPPSAVPIPNHLQLRQCQVEG